MSVDLYAFQIPALNKDDYNLSRMLHMGCKYCSMP